MFAAEKSLHDSKEMSKGFESMKIFLMELSGVVATGLAILASSMIDVSDPVVVTAGTAILGVLTGAVKVLWDRNNALSKATEVALSKCEEEHKKASANLDSLVQQVIALSGEVGLMKGRIMGFQEANERAAEDRQSIRNEMHGGTVSPPG